MDGDIAPLDEIVKVVDRFPGTYLFVDECHATGFLGATGRGTDEACGVHGRVDIINSTLGKALGGATGEKACSYMWGGWETQKRRDGRKMASGLEKVFLCLAPPHNAVVVAHTKQP